MLWGRLVVIGVGWVVLLPWVGWNYKNVCDMFLPLMSERNAHIHNSTQFSHKSVIYGWPNCNVVATANVYW